MKKGFYYDFADEVYSEKNEIIKKHISKSKLVNTTWIELLEDDNDYNKKKGNYITLEIENIGCLEHSNITQAIKKEIFKLLQIHKISKKKKILVVGLGNDNYLSDALGPKVISQIMVTSHILNKLKNVYSVSSFVPGVMSKTGLESANMVKALKEQENFDLIIVIDSLATTSPSRLYKVIQITDTGINPGSGVLNHRLPINQESIGCPVIVIGVATVVESSFIIYDYIKDYDETISLNDIRYILNEEDKNYIMTSKDIDSLINVLANLIAQGINKALLPTLDD